MSTWAERAQEIIEAIDAKLPADTDIKGRRKAYREEKPHEYAVTSWGAKTWARAQRRVLAKYGPTADSKVPTKHLSPLERMMARARP